ncbi:Cys/Met metabolism PLP-dependent enzyme [Cooperia oncophora]
MMFTGGTQRFLRRVSVPQHGIQADFVDLTNLELLEQAFRPNTKLIWFETPSNPLLKVVDVAAVVHCVKKVNPNILVVVDNTFMSPFFQRPLTMGADIVVHSITKYINGHSDVVMGAVITDNDDIQQHLFFQQLAVGAIPSPFDCFLVNRGLKTLHLRMKAHYANALAIAQYLESNERVESVVPCLTIAPSTQDSFESNKRNVWYDIILPERRTGGKSDIPEHAQGSEVFHLLGLVQFYLCVLKIFTLAESLGGYESLAELPSIMTHASVPPEVKL